MKKLALIIALLLLLSFAGATSITVSDEIPARINWSFSVKLNSTDSFEKSVILIDTGEILTIYPDGATVHVFPVKGSLVLDQFVVDNDPGSNSGLVLYVSYVGLAPGNQTIRVKTYVGGELEEDVSEAPLFYDVIAEINESDLAGQVAVLQTNLSEARDEIESIKADYKVFWDELNARAEQIDLLSAKIDSYKGDIDSSKAELSSLSSELDAAKANLSELATMAVTEIEFLKYGPPVEENPEANVDETGDAGEGDVFAGVAGLFGLIDASQLAMVIGAIIIIVSGAFLVRKRLTGPSSVYSGGKDEGELIESGEEDSREPEVLHKEDLAEEPKGKWAVTD